MKFTPEVIAALATLRDAAENDFERHRLDVLERDLTSPPQVEIIDDIHQKFDGIIYTIRDSSHYTKQLPMHRIIFAYYRGEIPEGYDIHHIDGDKSNNDISNLQCLTRSEHRAHHNKNSPCQQFICKQCGKTIFYTRGGRKDFCSTKCHSDWYRDNAHLLEERECDFCGKNFTAFPWQKRQYCSQTCAKKAYWQAHHKTPDICPICGKLFIKKRSSQQTCSRQCGAKLKKLHKH